ncbi:diguanylate cyclase (GGDEF) domain-containing protein [Paenibacillus tianmuensis]|uniref:Diguanylate cyclase (GGDEF) domain-containing protein n=1 Tax=Paenibacillus tianmuensis TaxID=624147 RepID=A0A1G4THT5_9BACL|nr:EAL domain-containing protein [Paenibacillus tianmuensis]SCW80886.1 diguanylate cyclase (GGDEF) domain-containing protein [Paenibacillus tianmuensis]
MAKKRSPAGSGLLREWRHKLHRHAALLHLLCVMAGVEIVLLSLKQLLGAPNDPLDFITSGLTVLLVAPILSAAVRNNSVKPIRALAPAVVIMAFAEIVALAVRFVSWQTVDLMRTTVDLAGLALLTTPILYFVLTDMRNRELTVRQLTYLAYHDMLTGLPNRQKFQQSVGKSIRAAKLSGRKLSVMFIDLDRFKNVNDTFGHAFGDLLLAEAAERLKSGLQAGDCVSRQGGDEFTVLIEDASQPQDIEKAAQKIIHLLSQPFAIDGHELRVGCSIGIAMYPQDGEDPITLMKNADTAMYQAKELGKNGYRFYKAEMNDTVIQKLVMEEWLNKALEQDEFVLYYQPQVDIFTTRMNGMEALIRWNHPRLGFISPGEFIPLAEETGLIIPIGQWVLRTACKQNKAWQLAGFPPLKMAVNISPIQFHQHDFVQVVLDALQESGLEPRYLELEITESIAMYHVDQVIQKLQTLRELGVHISMDDFGTGYSSLGYLKKFPIDKLKIAQQFVRDITVDPDDAAIVRAIMAMALSLKLNVIAEGVETEEQLSFLLDIKCREIQGYIYSKPVPANEFTDLIAAAFGLTDQATNKRSSLA